MGTGIADMIRRCQEVGLPEPQFSVTDGFIVTIWRKALEVTGQVESWIIELVEACANRSPLKSTEVQRLVGIRHRETFQRNYLDRLLREGWLERTIPEKPKSRSQKYRLTAKALKLLEK
jgi:ATP-dependent DNA helicase RecG